VTLKKEGIQTRNRKLSTKSKKKKSNMAEFFQTGFDGRYNFSSGGMGGPMSGYYHQMSPMSGMMSQYMHAGMGGMYMGSMPTGNQGIMPHLQSTHGMFSAPSPSMQNSIVAGATA